MLRPEPNAILIALTRPGALLAARLAPRLPGCTVLVAARHTAALDGATAAIRSYNGPLAEQVAEVFVRFDQLAFFLSVGAVVRLIAPHLSSKHSDPGVIAIDHAARFVVPVLSGHIGGANAFAAQLADLLGATAVITTASDALGTLSVDILGRELGWQVEADAATLKRVAATVVNGEPVALVQEAGSSRWWPGTSPLPENLHLFLRREDLSARLDRFAAVLLVTHDRVPGDWSRRLAGRLVVYRPPAGHA